ncbi:hypothetical protein BD410DRAFT_749596 [Rickenella mellea]|uniref:Protein kinase domain-containing protein n=1 Tax=Rickenella mellea TaxID=50990 RepID=A0A4Y7Q2M9_9AGAM|nr:hypothetical protein BD410DRAFT_749596 [Rickenella mellea]
MADDYEQYPTYTRFKDPEHVARAQRAIEDGRYGLDVQEIWWRDHQQFLESRGYLLRPRFRPGWVPSWKGTDIIPMYCEDSRRNKHGKTLDATRTIDGERVVIKVVPSSSNELRIARSLTTADKLQDPRNHCVPILDHFPDAADASKHFMVMPMLRNFEDPPFVFVSEVLDLVEQILQGIVFIHEHRVAHRDCAYLNLMMDGRLMYPEGYHFSSPGSSPTLGRPATHFGRSEVPTVKYYFTDFGISSHFPAARQTHLVTGKDGQDQDVPELSRTVPYDPFPVDIFILGNLIKKEFVNNYSNLEFLSPLTGAMTRRNPKERPTAEEALAHFKTIVAMRPRFSLRWRLRDRREKVAVRLFRDLSSASREATQLLKRLLGSPIVLTSLILSGSLSLLAILYGRGAFLARLRSTFGRALHRSR